MDIQGLRAVAVFVVVAFHAGLPLKGGFVGVDVFFVVSGFVITAMLEREWLESGRIRFKNFYLRRFKRLTPALALMISVTLLMAGVVLSPLGPQQSTAVTGAAAMLLSANIAIPHTTGGYFGVAAETNALLHTWSLSVEEQFYLIFPPVILLSWVIGHKRHLPWLPFLVVTSIVLTSFIFAIARSTGLVQGFSIMMGFFSPLTRAWEFAAGALLALVLAKWPPMLKNRYMSLVGMSGLTTLVASLMVIDEYKQFPGFWTLLPVVATLQLLYSGSSSDALSSRVLSVRPMVKIGDWSYSIYLWHWPLIVFAGFLWGQKQPALILAAICSLVPALISYRFVEQPLRGSRHRTESRRAWTAIISATVVPPTALAGALWSGSNSGWWSDPVRTLQSAALPLHAGRERGCDARVPLGSPEVAKCWWNQDSEAPPIYLMGDSNADHFSEGFIQAAQSLNRPIAIVVTNACPFVALTFRDSRASADNEACGRYTQGSLEYLVKFANKGLVVISNSDLYWEDGNEFQAGVSAGEESNEQSAKIAALRQGMQRMIAAIRKAGHEVLVVQTVPRWWSPLNRRTIWEPSRCTMFEVVAGGCVARRPLEDALSDHALTRSTLEEVASITGAELWDPAESLCPEAWCTTQGPLFTRYRDRNHISVQQSIALSSVIRESLAHARAEK